LGTGAMNSSCARHEPEFITQLLRAQVYIARKTCNIPP
jgi:hypothetical protein